MRRVSPILTLLLTAAVFLPVATPASGVTSDDAAKHRQKAAEARKDAEAAEERASALLKETKALDERIEELQSELGELAPVISEASSRTDRLNGEVSELRSRVTEKERKIEVTQREYERQQKLLSGRMTTSYKQGSTFLIDLLLEAHDIKDLIARTSLVQRVIADNERIASDLADTRDALEVQRDSLDRDLQAVQAKRAEASAEEGRLKRLRSQRTGAMNEQQSAQNAKLGLVKENKANAERLRKIAAEEEAESARIEAELSGRSSAGSGVYNGVMAWPVPGFYRISSPYGYRIHPIFGTRRLHTGIDIGRDGGRSIDGASIVAAGDGEVIYAGYRGGYGNTVMIDHGNGVVTLYAHQRSGGIKVSNGQSVSKSQRIGTVGSTGYSTGPHLHFEVRVNGAPVDPMPYLR